MKNMKEMIDLWASLCLCSVIFIISIFLTNWDTIYYGFQEQVDVYNSDEGYDYKGKGIGGNIQADVYSTLGEAGSIVTTIKGRFKKTEYSVKYYYIIPVIFNGETCYICTEVSKSQKPAFDTLRNNKKIFIPLTGTLKKLDNQIYKNMLETIENSNKFYANEIFKNDTSLKTHVLPVCLVPLDFKKHNLYISTLVALFVFAVFFLYMSIQKTKEAKEADKTAEEATLESLVDDYLNQTNSYSTKK